jgi:GTP-binding protein EngB required for normal cell division
MTTSISELNELRQNVEHFKNELVNCLKSELPDYKGFINDNIDDLNKVLGNSTVPDYYKVAIVGRFKVGKSSFVNALTDSRLAGVSTNPETAAISVFRYSENAYAEIDIISKEKWQELKDEHQENPEDISGANRYSGFINFDKEKNSNNADIEEQYIKQNGLSYRINAVDWTKTGQKEFLKKVKEFTSTNSPLHYLVNQITVYAPVDLLKEQIELIDTPGLADTVVFRALLTEEKVKDVDAILFLTASGGSYDQADKDFLKRQLRLGQLKQL